MPYINRQGRVAHGRGGSGAYLDNRLIDTGGEASWLRREIVYQHSGADGSYVAIYDVATQRIRRAIEDPAHPFYGRGANDVYGGGESGVWAAWLDGFGLFASTGLHLPDAGLLGVGPDGAIGYKPAYHGFASRIREVDGRDYPLSPTTPQELRLLGEGRAIWQENGAVRVLNLPMPRTLPGGVYQPHAVLVQGRWWIGYFATSLGLVLHPFDDPSEGYILATGNAWGSASPLDGAPTSIATAWSLRAGEVAGDVKTRTVDVAVDPRQPLAAPIDVPPVGRALWLVWFEHASVTVRPPGHGVIWARQDISPPGRFGHVETFGGVQLGVFVTRSPNTGEAGVAAIEAETAASPVPVLAYWDKRRWPRWPRLRPQDWLAIQVYPLKAETPESCEADIRSLLASVPPTHKIALVTAAYHQLEPTLQDPDTSPYVAVYARLARDHPRVEMIAAFTDHGRAGTGLEGHPELRPLWEALAAGIPSTPPIEIIAKPEPKPDPEPDPEENEEPPMSREQLENAATDVVLKVMGDRLPPPPQGLDQRTQTWQSIHEMHDRLTNPTVLELTFAPFYRQVLHISAEKLDELVSAATAAKEALRRG